MKYLLIIENAGENLSAYFPDVPGCVTVGQTVEEVRANAKEALELHLENGDQPHAYPLQYHLASDLDLDGTEVVTWVNYEQSLATA